MGVDQELDANLIAFHAIGQQVWEDSEHHPPHVAVEDTPR